MLEAKGVSAVKVDHLAKHLHVTRGSFYFHFADRKDLLDALLQDWRERNCARFEQLSGTSDLDGQALYETVTDLWLDEGTFRPKLDLAIRDWGRTSKPVAREVEAADAARIALLCSHFLSAPGRLLRGAFQRATCRPAALRPALPQGVDRHGGMAGPIRRRQSEGASGVRRPQPAR